MFPNFNLDIGRDGLVSEAPLVAKLPRSKLALKLSTDCTNDDDWKGKLRLSLSIDLSNQRASFEMYVHIFIIINV